MKTLSAAANTFYLGPLMQRRLGEKFAKDVGTRESKLESIFQSNHGSAGSPALACAFILSSLMILLLFIA